jgi:tetratricopeptide (TPR) repeat protein
VKEDHLGASTALKHAPSDGQARTLLAWAMMRQGRFDEAVAILDDVLGRDPMNALARATLGYVSMRQGRLPEAHDHMSRAAAQMRDAKAALYGCFYLGLLYGQQRDAIEAERYFRKTLSLAPNFIEAYYELGRTFWILGRFSDWGKRCAEAIRLSREGKEPPSYS